MYSKKLVIIFFVLISSLSTFSQDYTGIFNQAKSQYEAGQFFSSIRLLQQIENAIGPTIKTQSLLVYNYLNNQQFIEAKIALEKYKRLATYTTSEAHKKLLQQEPVINEGLRRMEDEFRRKEMTPQRKMQAAQAAINSTYFTNTNLITPQERENRLKYFTSSAEYEKGFQAFKKRIAASAAEQLLQKENVYNRELDYFKQTTSKSINVGDLLWTTENLRMTYFRDGTPIVMARNEEDWIYYFHAEIPCWRYFNYDPNMDSRLGIEYNMYALMNENQIAPEGWSVPTINDWKKFSAGIGDWNELYLPEMVFTKATKDGSKKFGYVYWNSRHRKHESEILKLKGKNKSGFSAIPNRSILKDSYYKDREDNNRAVWWAMTPKKDWSKTSFNMYDNLLEVRKDYETDAAAFYFTSTYNDQFGLSTKNTIFVYWNFLKEDELAKVQKRMPRYTDQFYSYTYDITKFKNNGEIAPPASYERRSTDHMQGFPIRLVRKAVE